MATQEKRLIYFEQWSDPVALEMLGVRDEIAIDRLSYASAEADNWARFAGAHGYQIHPRVELREPWFGTRQLLERCPDLLAICTTGSGYDIVDVAACTAAGVIVCNQAGANREAVAEHALGMMLALSKKIIVTDRLIRRERDLDRLQHRGNDLYGKTVGIIGLGRIGTRTAELCRHLFNMPILAYDPYVSREEILARHAEKVDLAELLASSDFVSVHCPRTSETFGMLGAAEFALMRPNAYFITTARGGIHKEDDLADALAAGAIAGAGLDVFLEEPPQPDCPLLAFSNVIATPHIAGMTAEALREMAGYAASQWIAIFDGERPPRLLNPEAWPRYVARFKEMFGQIHEQAG